MAVPLLLRPRAIHALFTRFEDVETPLAKYFPVVPSKAPGNHIEYDLLTYSRERGLVNTREGPPDYEGGPTDGVVNVMAETWRQGARISPTTLKDMREPGETIQNRAQGEVTRRVRQLRNRYDRFMEWLRAEALQGVKTYYPPGMGEHITELLLCTETCLIATVAYSWATAHGGVEATARTTLAAIQADFAAARLAMAAVGCQCVEVHMNSTTLGYIEANAIVAGAGGGYDYLSRQVVVDGHIKVAWGVNIILNDETYVHPITAVVTNYIATNVAIFLDNNNTRAGRAMIECEPVHPEAPSGMTGVYFPEPISEKEPPGEIRVSGEWTGQPIVAVPCSEYVLQDVTAV